MFQSFCYYFKRILPDEAAPSNYEMKGVTMSTSGSIVGEGKLPDPKAPPPPTPTTPMVGRPPLFKTESTSSLVSDSSANTESRAPPASSTENGIFSGALFTENLIDVKTVEETTKPEKFPPLGSFGMVRPQSPKPRKKSPTKGGEHFKVKSQSYLKSPGLSSPARSPGRPRSKSPARSPGRPKSPGRSPIMSPMAGSPLSPSHRPVQGMMGRGKSPGTGRSPGRPPKSPGTVGRPPKSPGRPPKSPGSAVGRPPKSPGSAIGRPPKSPGN